SILLLRMQSLGRLQRGEAGGKFLPDNLHPQLVADMKRGWSACGKASDPAPAISETPKSRVADGFVSLVQCLPDRPDGLRSQTREFLHAPRDFRLAAGLRVTDAAFVSAHLHLGLTALSAALAAGLDELAFEALQELKGVLLGDLLRLGGKPAVAV